MPLYPLKFQPIYKEKPWGGNKIRDLLHRDTPLHRPIGESWEISDRGANSTPVAGGEYAGKTLHSLIRILGRHLLGDRVEPGAHQRFPLLYKILDVEALLSLQVHPSDGYALKHEGESGKTEMWYILQADPGARVISGLKEGIDAAKIKELLDAGGIENAVRQTPIKKGDAVFIPAGRLHTLAPSCLLIEIQQNSDLTYRVHDWGRLGIDGRPRPLHLKKALEVIDYEDRESPLITPLKEKIGANEIRLLVAGDYFSVELLDLKEEYSDQCRGDCFQVLIGLEGSGTIRTGEGKWPIGPAEFILLPAHLGPYRIEPDGSLKILKSYP